jgi:hypothetical protein
MSDEEKKSLMPLMPGSTPPRRSGYTLSSRGSVWREPEPLYSHDNYRNTGTLFAKRLKNFLRSFLSVC